MIIPLLSPIMWTLLHSLTTLLSKPHTLWKQSEILTLRPWEEILLQTANIWNCESWLKGKGEQDYKDFMTTIEPVLTISLWKQKFSHLNVDKEVWKLGL